jgi:hypothetical protein
MIKYNSKITYKGEIEMIKELAKKRVLQTKKKIKMI